MRKALIVWRRTGKEHGEDSFRVNPPADFGGRGFSLGRHQALRSL